VLDAGRYDSMNIQRSGESYTIYSLKWEGYNIWGATAAMLMNLISRIEKLNVD
jgi:hypothetical protein